MQAEWQNTHLMAGEEHFAGGKTGITLAAGPCLCTCLTLPQSKTTVVVVLLKCRTG